jgi:hypothetical protein
MAKKSDTFRGTWCGRPGVQQTYYFQSNRLGNRVIVQWFDDSSEVAVWAMRGDFWRNPAEAVEYERVELLAPVPAQIEKVVAKLAATYFTKGGAK